MDSSQISNSNATRAALEGCVEVVNAYKGALDVADSSRQALKAEIEGANNRIVLLEEQNAVNEQNTEFLEKSLKKQKRKNIRNSILLITFASTSAALMVLYLTK